MNADNVDSRAFERAVREVLDAVEALEARDTAADNSDVRVVQANRELKMICDVTKPGLTSGDRPDATERLILNVDALN